MAENRLTEIYEEHVVIDSKEMTQNTQKAERFMKGFRNYMQRQRGEQPQQMKQGSAFEGLKVSNADEFDYILVYNMNTRSHFITDVEVRNVPNIPSEAGYWRLSVKVPPGKKKKKKNKKNMPLNERPWFKKWVEDDDSKNDFILSPAKFRGHLQALLTDYVSTCRLEGISPKPRVRIANPAFTVLLNGGEISIDMSIGVKVTAHDGYIKTYFAKKHRRDEGGQYWGVTYHEKEMSCFQEMEYTQRREIKKNYRISKFLLANVVNNSFVLKTAFLHLLHEIDDDDLKTKNGFLEEMIEYLAEAYDQKSLPGFFNQSVYNVLGKYSNEELKKMGIRFRKFNARTDSEKNMIGLIEHLLEDAIESESDSESDTDSDSDSDE